MSFPKVDKRRDSGNLRGTMRLLASFPGITLGGYFVWKVALLLLTSQPVPVDDAFFYDGPVVNYLLHGKYCNPALAATLPISGLEVYSAYPPLYQAVLLGWMKCFGPSALAAMWMHVTVLAVIAVTVLKIFRELKVPPQAINFAGLFFFGITFHERPDTVAQMFGMLAILAALRGLPWAAVVFLLLTFGTSIQTGGIYSAWLGAYILCESGFASRKLPWAALLTFVAVLTGLIVLVKLGHPRWWDGFREHVAITPSVTGWRIPRLSDLNKVVRNVPAVFVVVATLSVMAIAGKNFKRQLEESPFLRLVLSGCLAALAVVGGSLFILTPFTIYMLLYLQPVIVGGFLAVMATIAWPGSKWQRLLHGLLLLSLLLVSLRAIGISTWGVWCARDVSRTAAVARINQELDTVPAGATVFASGAHLYEIARRPNITWLQANWSLPPNTPDWKLDALEQHRPTKLILTPIDYYDSYETALAQLRGKYPDVEIHVANPAKVPAPEASSVTRKLLQYLSWSPIIVEISWPAPGATR